MFFSSHVTGQSHNPAKDSQLALKAKTSLDINIPTTKINFLKKALAFVD
jgi:hypothetical protein